MADHNPDSHTFAAHQAFAALFAFYADMGVEGAVDSTPRDFVKEGDQAAAGMRSASAAHAPGPESRAAVASAAPAAHGMAPRIRAPEAPAGIIQTPEAIQRSAWQQAAACHDLEALRAALETFEGCALRTTATRLVFGDGDPQARLMLVGEAPGADEDRLGLPFVGRAGLLLEQMLAAIGLTRAQVYIANSVPWRPPGNRTPTLQESQACLPFVLRQIALVNPQILVCLGGAAATALLGTKEGIMRVRGRWQNLSIPPALAGGADGQEPGQGQEEGLTIRTLATLHPAYLLRAPAAKRLAWRDLCAIRTALDQAETL